MLPNTHAKSSSSLDGVHPTCCHFSLSKSVATISFSPSCACVCMHCVPMSVRECVFVCMWRCVRGRIKHTGCYRSIYWMREYVCVCVERGADLLVQHSKCTLCYPPKPLLCGRQRVLQSVFHWRNFPSCQGLEIPAERHTFYCRPGCYSN